MKNFFSAMIKCKDEIYIRRDREAADIFVKVREFVEAGRYSSCKRASDIAKMTLRGLNEADIATHFGRSVETIRSEKRRISAVLWSIFPADFFDNLLDYKSKRQFVDNCMYALNYWGSAANIVLLADVVRNIVINKESNSADLEYSLDELKDELGVLRLYTREYLETNLNMVDLTKMNYIIDILEGKKGKINDKADIIKRLTE